MKAKQSTIPRALATGTRLACADNTGARTVQIISVFGYHGVQASSAQARAGDLATVSVQKGTPDMRRKLVRAVIIRQKKEMRRPNGMRVSFDDNAVVVVDEKNEPKGTEIKGPIAREVAERFPRARFYGDDHCVRWRRWYEQKASSHESRERHATRHLHM